MITQTQIGLARTLPQIAQPRAIALQAPTSLIASLSAPTADKVELSNTPTPNQASSATPPVWMRHLLIGAAAGAATGALFMGGVGTLAHGTFAEGAVLGAWLGGVPGAVAGPVEGRLHAWLDPNKDVAFDSGYRPVTAAVAGAAIGVIFPAMLVGTMFL